MNGAAGWGHSGSLRHIVVRSKLSSGDAHLIDSTVGIADLGNRVGGDSRVRGSEQPWLLTTEMELIIPAPRADRGR